jgi:hypothetical protein
MTTNHGHIQLESVRRRDAHPGAPGSFATRRELPARALARAGRTPVRCSEGAAEPRAGRHRGRAVRGADPRVPAGSTVFRSRCPQAVSAPAHGARGWTSEAGRGAPPPATANGQAVVRLSGRSSLGAVAAAVAGALRTHKISAVLTGGACAALYSEGAYHSRDLDFIVVESATRKQMDTAMESIGFTRRRDRLAAFYHWGDRQSLTVAAWIAARNRVNLATLQQWSAAEGATEGFEQFVSETSGIRRRMAPRRTRR